MNRWVVAAAAILGIVALVVLSVFLLHSPDSLESGRHIPTKEEAESREPVRIVDVIMFNGESVVQPRLEYLAPVVDEFVIVEAGAAFSPTAPPKKHYFVDTYREWFAPYLDKVTFVKLDALRFPVGDAWQRERFQRDEPIRQLLARTDDPQNTIVLCCDCDEIPTLESIHFVRDRSSLLDTPCTLPMHLFYYNLTVRSHNLWTASFALRLDAFRRITATDARWQKARALTAPGTGWHISYAMTLDEIRRKLLSFSHSEYARPPFTDKPFIAARIQKGDDLFGRANAGFSRVSLDDALPAPIRKFHDFIWEQQQSTSSTD